MLVHGRLDISSPPDFPWLAQAWPDATLEIVGGAGHGAGHPSTLEAILAATARFASAAERDPSC